MTVADLLRSYIAAGFDPERFWSLTPRLYCLHMEGAAQRIERELESQNRQAWNTAALVGAAVGGKLPAYDRVFGRKKARPAPLSRQPGQVVAAMVHQLAAAWGATSQ